MFLLRSVLKVLLIDANGCVRARLLQVLVEDGHKVVALVRSVHRLQIPFHLKHAVDVIEADLLDLDSLSRILADIDAAYYLVHSMDNQASGFSELETCCAKNFIKTISKTAAEQIIYLSGLSRESHQSEHMNSRKRVGGILKKGEISVTTLLAGIVIGSRSASFEIIRDLVGKLPVMIVPRWVCSKCQPIAIADALYYLKNVLLHQLCLGKAFEIGGPDLLTYKEMILQFAKVRNLRRWIIPILFLTPHLSRLWLFFITSTNLALARALVNSLKLDAVCHENSITQIFSRNCMH